MGSEEAMKFIQIAQEVGVTLLCVAGFFWMVVWNIKQNVKREKEYRRLFEKHDKLLEELVKIATSTDKRLTVIEQRLNLINTNL